MVDGVHEIRCNTGYRISPTSACATGDYYDNDDVNFTVIPEYISITLENSPIDFGDSANPGSDVAAVNNPLIITIDTNVNFDITTKANSTEFTSGEDTFPVSNMNWQTSLSSPLTSYTTEEAEVYSNQASPGGDFNIYHRLSVPTAQAPGSYNVGVVITAKKSE